MFSGHDLYTDRNDTFRDEVWKTINIDDGMIALPDDFIRDRGLPVSQRFPWDESKGIYLLHGYHNLHCVVSSALLNRWSWRCNTNKVSIRIAQRIYRPHRISPGHTPVAELSARYTLSGRSSPGCYLQRRRYTALDHRKRCPRNRSQSASQVSQLG